MAQINVGKVRVQNDSTTVKAVYTISLTGITGSFAGLGTIHWGPDTDTANDTGSGDGLAYDSSTQQLQFLRDTDLAPTVGQIIYIDTNNHATISSIANGSPPNWDKLLSGISGTKVLNVNADPAWSTVASFTSDTLTLATPWPGRTLSGVNYGINTDFTDAVSLPFISAGDANPTSAITRAFLEIDRRLKFNGALLSMASTPTLSAGSDDVLAFLTTTYDTGGFVADEADGFFTIPGGIAKVRMSFGVSPDATVAGVTGVSARTKKNSAANFPGSIRVGQADWVNARVLHAQSPVFSVAEGDTIKLHINVSGADVVVDDNGYTFFAIEAVELD